MIRQWGVDPEILCDDHLRREHFDMHHLVQLVRFHPHSEAIIDGHAFHGYVETGLVQTRHDELATELERRGLGHDSELVYDDDLGAGGIDVQANLANLMSRCNECSWRLQIGRRDDDLGGQFRDSELETLEGISHGD